MKKILSTLILLVTVAYFSLVKAQLNGSTPFQVGAAKVNMTPDIDALPEGYTEILDSLYVRAIVIENERTSAALIAIDKGMISNESYDKWTAEIEKLYGIPKTNIFISASHSHSAPFNSEEFEDYAVIESIRQAKAGLQKAKMSYSTGLCYLNVNRDVINPKTRLWSQGPNDEGPSEKTVPVITFKNEEGAPIAVYYNYAMHANTMFRTGLISADFIGETSKYIEEYYDNGMVALYSSGAAGDQNPIFFPLINRSTEKKTQFISSMGQILGEEVLETMNRPQKDETTIVIQSAQRTITCPGRTRLDTRAENREGKPGIYAEEEGEPVHIKLGYLGIGDIALTSVNAEVYTPIEQHLKRLSPFKKTIFASITNGRANSGYIPSDDAFQRYTFQVLDSRLQPNCAEVSIVENLVAMMNEGLQGQ